MASDTGRLSIKRSTTHTTTNSYNRETKSQSDFSVSEGGSVTSVERQRVLLRYYTSAHQAFSFIYRCLLSLICSVTHKLQNHPYRIYTFERAKEEIAVTRILRLGLLILSLQTGFLYAAYSGQLPLLLPFCRRIQATAEKIVVFHPLASNTKPEQAHLSIQLHETSDFSNSTSSPSVPITEVDFLWKARENTQKVQQQQPAPKEGEWKSRVKNPNTGEKEEHPGVPQEHHTSNQLQRLQLQGGNSEKHRNQRCRYQVENNAQDRRDEAHISNTKPKALTRDIDSTAPEFPVENKIKFIADSRLTVPVACSSSSEDEGHTTGRQGEGDVEGTRNSFFLSSYFLFVYINSVLPVLVATGRAVTTVFSQWNAAASLWCLILLFHFVPAQDKWPLRTRKATPAEHRSRVHSKHCRYSVKEKSLNTCVRTEDNKLTETLLDSQQQIFPVQRLASYGEIQSLPREQRQYQARRCWHRWKELKLLSLPRFFVERGECLELLMQAVELSVVGFFVAFFLAKSVFGCESILQQLEAHFAVSVLISHLQEYMFYFWYHPEKLSVDRFVFNNTFLYAIVLALSVGELLFKPHEFAVGATLTHVVRHAVPLSHTEQIHQQSESAISLVKMHRQSLLKQQHLLQSIRVNVLLLEISWIAHLVQAAIGSVRKHQSSNSFIPQCSSNGVGDSNRSTQVRDSVEEAVPLTLGRCRKEPVDVKSLFSSCLYIDKTIRSTPAEVATRSDLTKTTCCKYRSCCAACDHRHHLPHGKQEEEAISLSKEKGRSRIYVAWDEGEGLRDSAFFSAPPRSSTPIKRNTQDERDNVNEFSMQGGLQALDMSSEPGGRSGESVEETGECMSCWELSLLLCSWTLGALLCTGGLVLRGLAHFTARRNFTHKIASTRVHEHALVTHGVYAFMRHPGYAGTFYWAVGLQLMVSNVSVLLLTLLVLHVFFLHRIAFEERMLEQLFPNGVYEAYRATTPAAG